MEFQGYLALAHKKQKKHDLEVERIKKIEVSKKEERIQLSTNREISDRKRSFTTVAAKSPDQKGISKIAPIAVDAVSSSDKIHSVHYPKNTNSALKQNIPSNSKLPSTRLESVAKCESKPSVSHKEAAIPKKSKFSFAEILELAKKNASDQIPKRQPFDYLIPCSAKSANREPDQCNSKRSVTSCDTKCPISRSKHNNDLIATSSVSQKTKQTFHKGNVDDKFPSNSTFACEGGKLRIGTKKEEPSVSASNNRGCSSSVNPKNAHRPSKPEALRKQTNSSRLSETSSAINKPNIHTVNNKGVTVAVPKLNKGHKVDKTLSTSTKSFPAKSVPSENPSSKFTVSNVPKTNRFENVLPNRTEYPVNAISSGRGIAAQLGLRPVNLRSQSDSDVSQIDDYESDDSFIDDSEALESKDYAKVVRDVHKALRFDPRKYKEINPWDDLRSMETNYRDIEKEEKRSARLGAQEDAVELERDLQRKRQKFSGR